MKRHMLITLLCVGALIASGFGAAAGGGKPKPSVNYAKSWDAAVEEAKLLNVPMVVHHHGFY